MFTGIIQGIGTVAALKMLGDAVALSIAHDLDDYSSGIGDSIAVNGVCLTIVAQQPKEVRFEAVNETMQKTTLGSLAVGDRVNLEQALRLSDRLGGHLVQGHVDGVATLCGRKLRQNGVELSFKLPAAVAALAPLKGSIALDGISLTIAQVAAEQITIAVIPHTLQNTTLSNARIGQKVNVEADLMARYITHFLNYSSASGEKGNPSRLFDLLQDG